VKQYLFTSSLKGVAGISPRDPLLLIKKHPDIILAILVVSMLGMMIVPLPAFILDLFLTLNITFALTLLLSSLYIPNAVSITSFPTLLLLTTLFRLSLNISSTRLILLNGYAGEVINSFGKFVVHGNYIVGGVIFLILTLIQFIVIAKGSERVAEVSARFNLDSMPGKQMSIDADLRTGSISMEEAKELRRALERENQFYGAMDGAMKFVKGDAIAGIIITCINIIGGLAIGIFEKGLSPEVCIKKYTVLTIGDGLVSQIPSIVISTAAGIVVTRVASGEEGGNIGSEIAVQITKYPIALMIVSVLLLILSFIPGLPGLPFFIMGCVSLAGGYKLYKNSKSEKKVEKTEGKIIPGFLPPISLHIPAGMIKDINEVTKAIRYVSDELFFKFGVMVPEATVSSEELEKSLYIKIYGNITCAVPIHENCILVNESHERIEESGIPMESSILLYDHEYPLVKSELGEKLKALGISYIEGENIPAFVFRETLLKNLDKFIGINEVQTMLDGLSQVYPALVREVIPGIIPLPALSELLKRLLSEGVSVRNMRLILESIALHGQKEKNVTHLTELVRRDMRTEICNGLSSGVKEMRAYILNPELESRLMDAISGTSGELVLSIDPELATSIFSSIENCTNQRNGKKGIIIITQAELRPLFKKLVSQKFPDIHVISYEEIDPEFHVHPLGEIAANFNEL